MKISGTKTDIKMIAAEGLGLELEENTSLKACGVDSLNLVVLITQIEEKYGFSFEDDDLQPDQLETLEDLVSLTNKYRTKENG